MFHLYFLKEVISFDIPDSWFYRILGAYDLIIRRSKLG